MNKRKVAAMLAGMSAVGIVSSVTTTAHATELNQTENNNLNSRTVSPYVFTDAEMTQGLKSPEEMTYAKEVTLYFNGQAYLDGKAVTSGTKVTTEGRHVVTVVVNGENYKYEFSITNNINGRDIVSFSLGTTHSSAIDSEGNLYTWGNNSHGQLGDGTTTNRYTPVKINGQGEIPANAKIVSVSLGNSHSSAIDSEGNLYTWGFNGQGQVGDVTTTNRHTPVKINGKGAIPSNAKIVSASLGENHSSAIDSEGNLYTWGYNGRGELGDGTTTSRNTPVKINGQGAIASNAKIVSVSLGWKHSLAIDSEGNLYTWGINANGELGDGTTTNRHTPVKINGKGAIPSNTKIVSVSSGSGGKHSSAIDNEGNLYTWGYNYEGQLGDGTTTQRNTPVKINGQGAIPSNAKIVSVSLGGTHSSAIDSEGNLYTWGRNDIGQLGYGTITNRNTPVKINGKGAIPSNAKIVSVSLGWSHSSVIDSEGNLYIWGYNDQGELGDGTTTRRNTPQETLMTLDYSVEDTTEDDNNVYIDVKVENATANTQIAYAPKGSTSYKFVNVIDGVARVTIPKINSDAPNPDLNKTFELKIAVNDKVVYNVHDVETKLIYSDTEKPVITAPAISVVRGTADFDLKQDVTIMDNVDSQQDLLGKLVIDKGNFDINQAGTYQVTYKVTDLAGNESDTVTRTITVTAKTTVKPTISGANAVSIVQGTSFNSKLGVTAISAENEDLTSKITVSGSVNTNTPGDYNLTYTVTDRDNNTTTVERVVTVTAKPAPNTLPTINVKMEHEIFVGDSFDPLAIATATDKEDGDIILTEKNVIINKVNVNKPGRYSVKYEVIDNDGGRRTKVITVIVKERPVTSKKPVIKFPENTEIQTGTTFNPLDGVTATDYKGTEIKLTSANVAWNKVDTNKPGEYQVKYTVTDKEGNNKIVYRTVKVVGQATVKPPVTSKKPVITFPQTTELQVGDTFNPLAGVTATDYKGTEIKLTSANVAWNKVDTNKPGEYQVKYTVTDKEGNNKIVYRTVKVVGQATVKPPVTSKKPVITFPQTTELQVGDTFNPLAGVTATDYKNQNIKLDASNVAWNKVDTSKAGTYQVKYRVEDSEGNYKIVYRDVVVKGFTGLKGNASVGTVVMDTAKNQITVRGQVDTLTNIVNGTESNVSNIDKTVKYYLVAKDAKGQEVFKNYMVRVDNGGSYSGFKTNLSLTELEKIQDSVTLSLVVETLNTSGELELGVAANLNIVGEVQDTANNAKYTSTIENGKLKITKSQITRTSTNEEIVTDNVENKVTEETKVDSNIDNSIENNEANKVEESTVEEVVTENKAEASEVETAVSNTENVTKGNLEKVSIDTDKNLVKFEGQLEVSDVYTEGKTYLVAKDSEGKELFKSEKEIELDSNGKKFTANLTFEELAKITSEKEATLSLVVEKEDKSVELELKADKLAKFDKILDSKNKFEYTLTVKDETIKITKASIEDKNTENVIIDEKTSEESKESISINEVS